MELPKPSSLIPQHLYFLGEDQQQEDEEEEEQLHGLMRKENSNPNLPFLPTPPVASPKVIYSLSSGVRAASCRARTRSPSRPVSHCSSISSSMSSSYLNSKSSNFCTDEANSADFELPPVNPFDYMKTLLSQLAASISAMKTAYAHQQAALNPYNMQQAGAHIGGSDVPRADKAMVEELDRLSQLHSQLSLLPHLQQEQCQCKKSTCVEREPDMAQEEVKKEIGDSEMLKRYEGIITRFHDEIRRKDAVTAALKETLAKSLLRGEKLERRVKALEAQMRSFPSRKG